MSSKPQDSLIDVLLDVPEEVKPHIKSVVKVTGGAAVTEQGKMRVVFNARVIREQQVRANMLIASRQIPVDIDAEVTIAHPLVVMLMASTEGMASQDLTRFAISSVKSYYENAKVEALSDAFTLAMTDFCSFEGLDIETPEEESVDSEDAYVPDYMRKVVQLPPITKNISNPIEKRLMIINKFLNKAGFEFAVLFRSTIEDAWTKAIQEAGDRGRAVEVAPDGFRTPRARK